MFSPHLRTPAVMVARAKAAQYRPSAWRSRPSMATFTIRFCSSMGTNANPVETRMIAASASWWRRLFRMT
jgi:hypothetical protein